MGPLPYPYYIHPHARIHSRILPSDSPTKLPSTSGPFTTLGSRVPSSAPIWRASSVFPHPGGPMGWYLFVEGLNPIR